MTMSLSLQYQSCCGICSLFFTLCFEFWRNRDYRRSCSIGRNERQMLSHSGIHFQHSLHQQSEVTDVMLSLKNTHRQWHMDSITNLINCQKECCLKIMQLHQKDDVYSHHTSKSHAIPHWTSFCLNFKRMVLMGYNCKSWHLKIGDVKL